MTGWLRACGISGLVVVLGVAALPGCASGPEDGVVSETSTGPGKITGPEESPGSQEGSRAEAPVEEPAGGAGQEAMPEPAGGALASEGGEDPADPATGGSAGAGEPAPAAWRTAEPDADGWRPLFDPSGLAGWKKVDFGGDGEITVEGGLLRLKDGLPMTGIQVAGEPPSRIDYEIELEARRVEGYDFFLGLTFPVNDACASLIMGGWGGGVCGISSLDDFDAAENETSTYHEFTNGQWYRVRLRVTAKRFEAWLDKEKIVDQDTSGRRISTRWEITPCEPLGFASYQTVGEVRSARWRPVTGPADPPAGP